MTLAATTSFSVHRLVGQRLALVTVLLGGVPPAVAAVDERADGQPHPEPDPGR